MSKEIKILGGIVLVVIAAAFIITQLYNTETQKPVSSSNPAEAQARNEALIRPDSPTLGDKDAKVTIVEFLDPECEACAAFHPTIKKVLKDYDGKTRLVVRYMPLHPNSVAAATFLEAAAEQGKYWEAQDLLFQKQPEWGTKHGPAAHNSPKPDIPALFKGYAKELKLDMTQFDQAFIQNKYAQKIERDRRDGQSLGVRQTPTIFVNGKKLATLSEPALTYLIDQELKKS